MPADAVTLDTLRHRIAAIEQGGAMVGARALPLGPAAIDDHLPWGGLPAACLHEVLDGDGLRGRVAGAASAFTAALAARMADARPVLWITGSEGGRLDLYAPGLAAVGLAAAALIVVSARGTAALWAMEEALREPAVGAVVAEIGTVDLTASRRLQLAAEAGGAGAFLLRPEAGGAPTASVTRWRVAASGSGEVEEEVNRLAARSNGGVPPVGTARWRLELLRCRGGRPAAWTVEWCHATGDLALAAPLSDRPAVPAARGGGRPYALAV